MMLNKLSLNTIGLNRIGLNRIGKPSRGSSDRPYIDPEVLASLKAVCICYGKSNDDPDRAIVKNLVDPDNPFIISNAAYKLNSGYGLYEDFSVYKSPNKNVVITDTKIKAIGELNAVWVAYSQSSINQYKVKITGIPNGGRIGYIYRLGGVGKEFYIYKDGIYNIPASDADDGLTGYLLNNIYNDWSNLTIEQIPSYQGAFVTDGVDDLITSTKTVQEMLGGSNEITIVSMVHQVKDTTNNVSFTNYIRGSINGYFRNIVNNYGKTGIYGYTSSDLRSLSVINNILGDKNDYTSNGDNRDTIINGNFNVQGYSYNNSNNTGDFSSVAWYWTIIANKVLTTDQINQVIAYYNWDRCVEPTVLYDVKRQGLSNDTPDSDWYLKDFSKNGFDMSLFNFAKKLDSGIGKYATDFTTWIRNASINIEDKTKDSFHITNNTDERKVGLGYNLVPGDSDFEGYKIEVEIIKGSGGEYKYYDEEGHIQLFALNESKIYTLPTSYNSVLTTNEFNAFFINPNSSYKVTQIPSHAGALCFDGVEDYGKVTGLPIYKDYTVVADYERIDIGNIEGIGTSPVLSKSYTNGQGSFIMNFIASTGNSIRSYSFGTENTSNFNDLARQIFYQSKYKNQGFDITAGTGVDGDSLWLGTARDKDSRFFNGAIYSLMTFPYSLSEFLIERQLKKHKLGTLYPDMVEFRPVIKTNVDYTLIQFYINNYTKRIYPGDYIPINTPIQVNFYLKNNVDELISFKVNGNDSTFKRSTVVDNAYNIETLPITESPQKIEITIDEYIRYEDIVQPYPEIWNITQNAKKVSWGDKLKVGSEFGYNSKVNLLSGLYSTANSYYNGKVVKTGDVLKVEKQMVFACDYSWIGGSNEPKCILSPSRLRIPNSSYKILGYIPDISGHGNHGKINNSAYAGMSGANGYVENFTTWGVYNGAILTDNTIKTNSNFNPVNSWVAYKGANTILNSFSVNITGIPEGGILNFRVNADTFIELSNGRNDLSFDNIPVTVSSGFRITKGSNLDWSNLVIQQIGQYEGAYCLDGVDDFITIPTTVGGKQVLMKVNWQSSIGQGMLYDQRGTAFAIWNSDKYNDDETDTIPAYSARNGGNTYIDGILNKNILASQLRNITHNIVATNTMLNGSSVSPTIGCRTEHDAYFTNMSLYDFMLFDEIDSDEEILTLNEYVGIEGNTDDLFTENN